MATDSGGLSDDVTADLNPADTEAAPAEQAPAIPDRPADGAGKAKWAAYVVALGLHPDEAEKQSKSDLIDLADRLGG